MVDCYLNCELFLLFCDLVQLLPYSMLSGFMLSHGVYYYPGCSLLVGFSIHILLI